MHSLNRARQSHTISTHSAIGTLITHESRETLIGLTPKSRPKGLHGGETPQVEAGAWGVGDGVGVVGRLKDLERVGEVEGGEGGDEKG